MNENFYNQRKMRSINLSTDLNKNGHTSNGPQLSQNFSHNTMHSRQPLNQHQSSNHIPQNMLPHLVNLISPQISVSQPGNQPTINMGFNVTPFLQNHLYSLPSTFGALNTMATQGYNNTNVSYMNNMHMSNNDQTTQSIVNYKDAKVDHMMTDLYGRKLKVDTETNHKVINYPVRLLVNSELVGPLIGRKGEKIKEITAATGAKIDIKRESVPYSQFGLNNYMFSGCNRKGNVSGDGDHVVTANNHSNRGESQIVFIVGEPDKCTAAIEEIMQLCTQEATEQGREEPNLGLLAEDRFCARIIGKEGRYLNFVRYKSSSQVHVSNVPTITTLSQQPHMISLDRIISCRGGGLASLLEAEKLISEKIRQCVTEDNVNSSVTQKSSFSSKMTHSKDDSFLPTRAAGDMALFNQYCNHHQQPQHGQLDPLMTMMKPPVAAEELLMSRRPQQHLSASGTIGSGIVHKANPNWPDNLKLDENLYVRIPQLCAGSIIGSEGKSVKRIMAETGTYIQVSKTNLSRIESVPAVHTYRRQTIPSCSFCIIGKPKESMTAEDTQKTEEQQPDISDVNELEERLVTIKGAVPSQCSALAHIFNRVKVCHNQGQEQGSSRPQEFQDVRLWVVIRVPKIVLGRLIGKDGKVIRQLQLNSRTFLSFPRLRDTTAVLNDDQTKEGQQEQESKESSSNHQQQHGLQNPDSAIFGDVDLHPLEIFGNYDAVETAVFMVRRLVYSCIFTQYGPALIAGPLVTLNGPSPATAGGSQIQPTFVMPHMFPWQQQQQQQQHRRNHGDFSGYSYYNSSIPNIPRVFGGVHLNSANNNNNNNNNYYNNNCNNSNNKNFKRPPQFSQRSKNERRSQSENKTPSRNESGDNHDPLITAVKLDDGDEYNCDQKTSENPATSPKRVLMKPRLEAPSPSSLFTPELNAPSSVGTPRYNVTSPCSTAYYTDCSPVVANDNTLDDLSFTTAVTNVQESLDNSFSSDSRIPSSPHTSANNSFSHWSLSPKPPF